MKRTDAKFNGAEGENRTRTSEETGFWIRRVYQFRHPGKDVQLQQASKYKESLRRVKH